MDLQLKSSVNIHPQRHRHVVAMPYPGRGHINPMLNLCNLISSKCKEDIFITFVVTQEWLGFLRSEPQSPANIRFAALPQVIPSEINRAANFPAFYEATATKLQDPFVRLLDRLDPPPTAIIYDTYLSWVVGVGNRRNIPVASLFTMSASVFTVFFHFDLLAQHDHFPLDVSERGHENVNYIPGLPSTTISDMPTFFDGAGNKVLHRVLEAISAVRKAQYLLFTSIYEFERQAIDTLKDKLSTTIYHIGPMIPYFRLELDGVNGTSSHRGESYFQWLDSQPEDSVLYISQGSFLSVSSAQMDEIVYGIKESGVRFLWVTRGDSSRFKDSSSETGFFLPWCDQLKVLCHPSVGGFWTHCGWNSTSEGVYAGVPMLTCPIFWDQMPNSKLIVSDWKIGCRVIKKDKMERLVTRHEIAQLVKNFMDSNSDERKKMVTRAKTLRDIFRRAVENGNSASNNLDTFIKSIS